MTMKMRLKIINKSCLKNVPLHNDGYMYYGYKLSNTKTELKKKSIAYTKKSVFKILARSPKKINKRIHFR